MRLYPLQFNPILKERVWGGTKLKSFLNKSLSSEIIGESWEITTVGDDISVISKGHLKGKSLQELIDTFPIEILGNKVYDIFGKQFPLLFKYLDARENLSIQVHPNDVLAKERHNSFGKTEMWYVMQTDPDAKLIIGFKKKSTPEEFLNALENKSLLNLLNTKKVNEGDVFFLNPGTVHAIGAGTLIAEIQQTSDITYRVFDFDRIDKNGNTRELHLDLALDAINYNVVKTKQEYKKTENCSNEVVSCEYFITNIIPLNGKMNIKKNNDSFRVYMCTKGDFKLYYKKEIFTYRTGDTVLLPAQITSYELEGEAILLEIQIS